MKRKLLLSLGILSLASALLTGYTTNANETETKTEETEFYPQYYPLLMQVTEIEESTGYAYATDNYGSEWAFDREDACMYDLYSCIMNDNGTEEIEDDYIVKMRYVGHPLDFVTEVTSCDTTETGTMINFSDGTGYYIEYGN